MSKQDQNSHHLSEIARAVVLDDIDRVRELTSQGQTVAREPFPFDETALHIAAEHGNVDMIPILLEAGGAAYINSIGGGSTPLGLAVKHGHVRVVEALLSRGAFVNARDEPSNGDPPLTDAVDAGYEDIVGLLLSAGADPNIPGWVNLTALDYAKRRVEKDPSDVSRRILDAVLKAASKS